ncbi:MAG: hypothetical protein Q7S92_00315 [Candidatus Diapherotrites archaeon]|nr:hypothetical protein [Candidatus Diapherotrites archaeon]
MPKPTRRWLRQVARQGAFAHPWTVPLKPDFVRKKPRATTAGQPVTKAKPADKAKETVKLRPTPKRKTAQTKIKPIKVASIVFSSSGKRNPAFEKELQRKLISAFRKFQEKHPHVKAVIFPCQIWRDYSSSWNSRAMDSIGWSLQTGFVTDQRLTRQQEADLQLDFAREFRNGASSFADIIPVNQFERYLKDKKRSWDGYLKDQQQTGLKAAMLFAGDIDVQKIKTTFKK